MIAPKDELFSLSQNHNIMKCAERGNIQRRWLKELSMLYGPMEHKPSVPHNSYKGDGREEGKKERRNEGREGGGEDLGSTLQSGTSSGWLMKELFEPSSLKRTTRICCKPGCNVFITIMHVAMCIATHTVIGLANKLYSAL